MAVHVSGVLVCGADVSSRAEQGRTERQLIPSHSRTEWQLNPPEGHTRTELTTDPNRADDEDPNRAGVGNASQSILDVQGVQREE